MRLLSLATSFWIFTLSLAAGSPTAGNARPASDAPDLRPHPDDSYSDTLRALIVFVMFRDDRSAGDPAVEYRGWPLFEDAGQLPAHSVSLLAAQPRAPWPDSSLTAYFYSQSGGRFLLIGDVWPNVHVTLLDESAYHRPDGGYGSLTMEILSSLDDNGVDFGRYDFNRDGVLDQLFLIIRSDSERDRKSFAWTGASCLDARCGGGPAAGQPLPTPSYDNVRIDWNRSGSIIMHRTAGNIDPHYYLVRLLAHEIGHDLWARHFVHVPALRTNDVPISSNRRPTNAAMGYTLMAGAGGGMDCNGLSTISAYERELLGWIDCEELSATRQDIVLRDLYTNSQCFAAQGAATDSGFDRLLLSYHERIGPFDRRLTGGVDHQFELGQLRTEGLLATLVRNKRFDVLPADNTLDLSARDAAYAGDLYGGGSRVQLTPWTRPSINGFNQYPAEFPASWHAVDNIRRDGPGTVLFDYVRDFRDGTVIRRDSWMTQETLDQSFPDGIRITYGATLTVQTAIKTDGRLIIEPGGTLVVDDSGSLRLGRRSVLAVLPGARLDIRGMVEMRGVVITYAGSHVAKSESASLLR